MFYDDFMSFDFLIFLKLGKFDVCFIFHFHLQDTGPDKNLSTQSSSDDCAGGVMSPDDKLFEMTLINSGRG